MKMFRTFVAAFVLMTIGSFALVPTATVGAAALDAVCENNEDSAVCQNRDDSSDDFVKNIINTLLYVVGALSVLMIIVGGILYVTSSGDASSVTKAKNTILYAVVGLVVSVLAFAIVNWVIDQF
jgi:hypothetical protein